MVEETTPVRRSSEIETRVGTRVDNALPRTWHRDLVFARTLLGSTPIGVLWPVSYTHLTLPTKA